MSDFCPNFSGKKAHTRNAQKGINMHKANGIGYINLLLHTKEHKAERTSNGNRQTTRRRRAYRLLHDHIITGEIRHR